MEGRLQASIHHARFIDLGVQDDPSAIKPLWGYHDPETKQAYDSVLQAFATCQRRLLLLGDPGSGKTTALLQLAKHLITEAECSVDAPLPFVLNLSKFRFSRAADSSRFAKLGRRSRTNTREQPERRGDAAIETWLVSQMAEFPGLSFSLAQEWLRDGRVVVLMDGLDEFDDSRRLDLASSLNAFLRDYPDLAVVVCSRTNEYEAVKSYEETRLNLRGCVQLLPLEEGQIATYLKSARADVLLTALPDDSALRELAKTPLTLSMLVLAYGGLASAELPLSQSLTERRHHLFESYVARMLQRHARRELNVPFDDSRVNDVRVSQYRYDPGRVDRWLGWLALVLSARMRTTFALNRFHSMLRAGANPSKQIFNFFAVNLALAALLSLSLFVVSLPTVPPSLSAWASMAWIGGGLFLLFPIAGAATGPEDPKWAPFFLVPALLATILLGIAELTRALCETLSLHASPLAVSLLVSLGVLTAVIATNEGFNDRDVRMLGLVMISGVAYLLAVSALSAVWHNSSKTAWWLQVGVIGFAVAAALAASIDEEFQVRMLVFSLAIAGAFVLSLSLGIVGQVHWALVALGVGSFIIIILVGIEAMPSFAMLVTFSLFGLLGGILKGPRGTVVSLTVFGLLSSVCITFKKASSARRGYDEEREGRLFLWWKDLSEKTMQIIDRIFLSPCTLAIVAVSGRFPSRARRFVAFAQDAFLLKKSSKETEFTHRLLRDYFAMQQLLPSVRSENRLARLASIRALGYQGESALDFLSELSDNENESIRAAAVSGISHIASPTSISCLERHLNDRGTEVRKVVIEALFRFPQTEMQRLFDRMQPLGNGCEIGPLLTGLSRRRYVPGAQEMLQRMGQSAVEHFLPYLRDKSSVIRGEAAKALGQLGNKQAARPLCERLRTENDRNVRLSIVRALGSLRDNHASETLWSCLLAEKNEIVYIVIAQALCELADQRIIPECLSRLKDPKEKARSQAAHVLGRLNYLPALGELLTCVQDKSEKVCISAARAIVSLQDRTAVDPLVVCLKREKRETVRAAVAETLGRLGDPRAADGLAASLGSRSKTTRRAAAVALARLGDSRAADALFPILSTIADSSRDIEDLEAFDAVVQFWKASEDKRAREALVLCTRSRDRYLRTRGSRALEEFDAGRARPTR